MRYLSLFFVTILFFAASNMLLAADDPSITGKPRTETQKVMSEHIEQNMLGDEYIIYDDITGELMMLEFKELHSGIVKKGNFYVSCADFVDAQGNKYDLDFFVAENKGNYIVYDAIVHKVNGDKRPYNLDQ